MNLLSSKEVLSIQDLLVNFESSSKATLVRDLNELIDLNLIQRVGKARASIYKLLIPKYLLEEIDVNEYFKINSDKRSIKERFNFALFDDLEKSASQILNRDELNELELLNHSYLEHKSQLSQTLIKKETERLVIDLSWKSSEIEGNTYSLLETEYLIKTNKPAPGHNQEEAQMILNHKYVLDYIFENPNYFTEISLNKIEEIHSMLIKNLNVKSNIRKNLVGISGTKYKPLDNEFQIKEALEKMCKLINNTEFTLIKAILAVLLISYIQPFEDGNKRTGRILATAILIAANFCPISYRSIDDIEYKKATLLFYEQNNMSYFKKIFIEQFKFAIETYFC